MERRQDMSKCIQKTMSVEMMGDEAEIIGLCQDPKDLEYFAEGTHPYLVRNKEHTTALLSP